MWIKDMTKIMLEMDTSMELKFSLDWKAKEKLSENELDIKELEVLLRKDVELLPSEDLEKISSHFKSKLKLIREELEENKKEYEEQPHADARQTDAEKTGTDRNR